MLRKLTIQNYALLQSVSLEPGGGLSIITGETGAGKSIMLDALGLLTGARADGRVLQDPQLKCVVEAEFDTVGDWFEAFFAEAGVDAASVSVVRREVSPSGTSRAFINDTPTNLTVLKSLGAHLVDVHSQHQTLLLNRPGFQMEVLDAVAGHGGALEEYRKRYQTWASLQRSLATQQDELARLARERDFIQFQFDELQALALKAEDAGLEEELERLTHVVDIRLALEAAVQSLEEDQGSAIGRLQEARQRVAGLASFPGPYAAFAERLQAVCIEVKDLSQTLADSAGKLEADPGRQAFIEERLSALFRLQKKHQVSTVVALLQLQHTLDEQLQRMSAADGQLEQQQAELARMENELRRMAQGLSKRRTEAAPRLEQQVAETLHILGMPHARLQVSRADVAHLTPNGLDQVNMLFSANKGQAPAELAKVASGGELSRLMLAIKALQATHTHLPTLILDEIDTGVSGEVAARVGEVMESMAATTQLLAITHLPQIAAKGKSHFMVYKVAGEEKTNSHIRLLSPDERIQELAKMLSAGAPGEAALNNARELLNVKKKSR
jgi:DNA repair protein RecN (Recombination protein N)